MPFLCLNNYYDEVKAYVWQISEKGAKIQRNNMEQFRKIWRTIVQGHLKNTTECDSLEEKYKEIEGQVKTFA